jgi:hypothetical protein
MIDNQDLRACEVSPCERNRLPGEAPRFPGQVTQGRRIFPPWSASSATRHERLHFYISAIPGGVLALSVHGFNLICDALSPRQR